MTVPPELQKIQDAIDFIQANPDLVRAYEGYAKAASDYTSGMNGARWEGELEGKREQSLENARSMKADNMSISKISNYTGLSEQEIQKL